MPVMSRIEAAFCRRGPWQTVTAKIVMPRVLHGQDLGGDVLDNGAVADLAEVPSS